MTVDTTAPLTRMELDLLTCQVPGCSHTDHQGLLLKGRCHRHASTIVRLWGDGVAEVRCKVCNSFIGSVRMDDVTTAMVREQVTCDDPACTEPLENHSIVVKSTCHKKVGLLASYVDGHLHILCATCKKNVISVHVAAGAPS
jgi:hypothetical protein